MLAPSQPSRSGPPRLPLLGAAHSSWCSLHLPPPSAGCCTLILVLPPSPTSLCWVLNTHLGAPSISHLPLLGAAYSSWCSLHLPPRLLAARVATGHVFGGFCQFSGRRCRCCRYCSCCCCQRSLGHCGGSPYFIVRCSRGQSSTLPPATTCMHDGGDSGLKGSGDKSWGPRYVEHLPSQTPGRRLDILHQLTTKICI